METLPNDPQVDGLPRQRRTPGRKGRRVVVVGPVAPWRGGIAHHTTALAEALAAECQVTVITYRSLYPDWLYPGQEQRDLSLPSPAGVTVLESLHPLGPSSWRKTGALLGEIRPDTVVIPWWTVFLAPCLRYVAAGAKLWGARTIFLCHNAVDHEATWWKRRLSSWVLRRGDRLLTHTNATAAALHELAPDAKIVVHPHPVYHRFVRPAPPLPRQARLELLFFGFVRPYKGVDVLLQAMASLPEQASVHLTIAGEVWGECKPLVQLCRENQSLRHRVTWIDRYVDDDEVAALFERADAVVLPYRSCTGSGVIATAVAHGRPMILSDLPGFSELVENGREALLVAPENAAALADLIAGLTPEALAAMRPAVARLRERLSWPGMVNALLAAAPARPPSAVLVGTYNSLNCGDAAMQRVAAHGVAELGGRAVVASPFPALDAPFYAPVGVVGSLRRRLNRGTLQVACAWLGARGGMPFLVWGQEARAIAAADLTVDLSGDMLTEASGLHLTWSHFLPIMLAMALGRPVFVCAQSIGPFRLSAPLARAILRRAAAVTARDAVTARYLEETLGVPVRRTADLAFLLPATHADEARAILDAEGLPSGDGPLVGVSISPLILRTAGRRRDGVLQELAGVLDTLIEQAGVRVLFVAHVRGPGPGKDDRRAAGQVLARMNLAKHAIILQRGLTPEQNKGIIGLCALFVGARMHANIAALSQAVPTVALSYSHKTPGIMGSLGQAERVVDMRRARSGAIRECIFSAWRERDGIAAELARALPGIRAQAAENLQILGHLLGVGVGDGT